MPRLPLLLGRGQGRWIDVCGFFSDAQKFGDFSFHFGSLVW